MKNRIKTLALASCAFMALGTAAHAEEKARFDIAGGDLKTALQTFAGQTSQEVLFSTDVVAGRRTKGVAADADPQTALLALLDGTGLTYRTTETGTLLIMRADAGPQSGSAAGGGAEVEALIVTAQKKEEAIQDVPIAISAFTQKALEEQKIEGGFDLVKAVPNVTFSKNNFSGYNFSIRGIGTKAISVTTDPGVAVSFNNVTLIRNRLFEQEYFDLERVEVLRGPQGTLYGRNATSGVVNVISAKPDMDDFSGSIKGEVGNYDTKRLVAMVNVPLIDDVLALRLAGATTTREGYSFNLYNNEPQDGRDLWSARLSVGFQPSERLRANLIWERFEEDDDRSRTGKQLCTHDAGPENIGSINMRQFIPWVSGNFTQGCLPGSLYDDKAFGTPNGFSIPFIRPLGAALGTVGWRDGAPVSALTALIDPYGNTTQSRNLRELYSQILPIYRAKADVIELNLDYEINQWLSLSSQTAFNEDQIYATQDFNRYTTLPVIADTTGLLDFQGNPSPWENLSPNGVFCDPQVGCSDTIVGQDLSRAKSRQLTQEFRLQSAFDGPLNFTAGLSYTEYKTVEDYYVFFNAATMASMKLINAVIVFGGTDPSKYTKHPDCSATTPSGMLDGVLCVDIENNPISDIQDTGHNYFLSRNPYRLTSKAVFGEVYWNFRDDLKITAGLRYTDDEKITTPIPSETLLTDINRVRSQIAKGELPPGVDALPLFGLGAGYPALPDIERRWREFTGRIGADWRPTVPFTDQTMIYGFYSRGYKAGGMNPPRIGFDYEVMELIGIELPPSAPPDFDPEFVNAFEIGAKNTLLGGGLILNLSAFYYDYMGYQISKIVDRSAANENFDAKVWGLELESVFRPTRNLRFNASLGYLDSKLGEGSKSIDIMNRTAGRTDWMVVKPVMTLTSNCIAPVALVEHTALVVLANDNPGGIMDIPFCPGGDLFGNNLRGDGNPGDNSGYFGISYDPRDYPEANFGAGFDTDVSGHELPNAPHWTVTLGSQYSYEFAEGWKATVRGDFYWQSQQWARIYQLPVDKIHAWKNGNLSLLIERPDDGLALELYAKNIFDDTPITDTFTNSDDTALTTNIFVLDPRLIGLSIKKTF